MRTADGDERAEPRSSGRPALASPPPAADCGARVLELLYCYQCGEAFLGGFTYGRTSLLDGDNEWYLSSLRRLAAGAAEKPVFARAWGDEYMWFWPGAPPDRRGPGTHARRGAPLRARFGSTPTRGWAPGARPAARSQRHDARRPAGATRGQARAGAAGALPALRRQGPTASSRSSTAASSARPIRAHTAGQRAATQIVLDRVVRSIGEDPPQEAARSSSPTAATTPPAPRPASSSTTSATWCASWSRPGSSAPLAARRCCGGAAARRS